MRGVEKRSGRVQLSWTPEEGWSGDRVLVDAVRNRIDWLQREGRRVGVTATGPFLDPDSPDAVGIIAYEVLYQRRIVDQFDVIDAPVFDLGPEPEGDVIY